MPAAPPVAFATLAARLPPPRTPIRGITPTTLSNHLVLSHGEPHLTIADNQTLQAVDTLEGHTGTVTTVTCERGSIWSAGLDALIVQWDERSRRSAAEIKAFIKHALPLTALATHDLDHLVIGGTDGPSSSIIYWDTRNTAEPAYVHDSTHDDDVTHLSLLPPTATWAKGVDSLPPQLLLSASKDGYLALSDLREVDGDDALVAAASAGSAVDSAGAYLWKGGMRVWARSGDAVTGWGVVPGEKGGLEFVDQHETRADQIVGKTLKTPAAGPSIVHPAMDEQPYPPAIRISNLIGVVPSMGISKAGTPMIGVSTEDGNIVLQHQAWDAYTPSAFLVSGPDARGHKSSVRAMFHAARDEALYTGSEDGVLAGWSIASLPRMLVGDPEIDDDGGDGREDINSADESEESEIETEESDEESDRSDRSDGEDEEEGPRWGRHGPVYGGGRR